MIRKLLIVAASALVLAILSFSIGWVVGGPAILEHINKEGGISVDLDDDDPKTPRATRSLPFNASQLMVIDAPVELEFTRGPEGRMTVEGPAKLVESLKIENGRLFLDHQGIVRRGGLRISITAPEIPPLELRGPGDITLIDVQQKQLKLNLAGAANVEGSGKVDMLDVNASGAGNLDFERLAATDGKINIAGIGNADLRVSGKLDANISGAGNVTLHTKPQMLTSHVSGIGSVDENY